MRACESTKARRLGPVLESVGAGEVEQLTRLLERFSTLLFRTEADPPGYCLRCAAYGDASCPLCTDSCPYVSAGSAHGLPADTNEEDDR